MLAKLPSKSGGRTQDYQVTDNGEGMDHEDVPLLLAAMLLVKSETGGSLSDSDTGFSRRGIPSIASVAFTIETATRKWPARDFASCPRR